MINIRLRVVAALVLLSAFVSPGAECAAKKLEFAKFESERPQMAAALAVPIAACVARRDTIYPVFHGCIDWHSAVHGVWALTAYGWATHDTRYDSLVQSILNPQRIAEERNYLAVHPDFEMPYGRAWFLRLAIDSRNAALDGMADDVAASLVSHFTATAPRPESIAYDNSTWALINLYEYGKLRGNPKLTLFVSNLVKRYYLRAGACPVQALEVETGEFMALCTNWAWLVGDVLPHREFVQWLGKFLPADRVPRPIVNPASVHQNGLNFSRAWGLWALYRKTGDNRYLDAYLRHVRQAYANPATWKGGYETVAHWVPQFGMLALMVSYYNWPSTAK